MDGWTGRPCMTKALSVIFFYDGVFTERNVHKRMLLSKNYYCDPCGTNCSSQKDFNTHLATATHKKSIIHVARGRQLEHRYYLCYKSLDPTLPPPAKAAKAKAIVDNPGAIKAAKAATLACNGDFSKAISKFNTELDPVDFGPPEVFDFTQPPKAVPDDIQPQPPARDH
jgi:hypothetical protein